MPSLSDLREFKASFDDIGSQKTKLEAKGLPVDDMVFPDKEPEPIAPPVEAEPDIDMDSGQQPSPQEASSPEAEAPQGATPQEAPPEEEPFAASPLDSLDFSAFLDSQPKDLPVPPVDDIPGGEEPAAGVSAEPDTDDLYFPQDLLNDFPTELDATLPDTPPSEEVEEEPAATDSEDINLDDLGDFGLPEEPAATSSDENFELDNLDNIGLPEKPAATDSEVFNMDDLGDFGLPEEPAAASGYEGFELDNLDNIGLPEEPAAATGGDDINLDDLGNMGLPEETAAADSEDVNLDDLGDFGLPEEPAAEDSEDVNLDDLGDFGLPETPAAADSEDISLDELGDMGLPDEPAAAAGGEDVNLDDLGDIGLPDKPAAAAGGEDVNLDDLGDIGLPDEPTAAGGEDVNLDDLGDIGLPDEPAAAAGGEDINLDDLGDIGLPEEPAATDSEDISLDDLGDIGLPDEPAAAAGGENAGIGGPVGPEPSNKPAAEDTGKPDTAGGVADDEEIKLDSFDNFIPGAEAAPPEDDSHAEGTDDFSFPGLDNILDDSPRGSKTGDKAKGLFRGKSKDFISVDDEEIQLTDEQLARLQETLTGYPLNLRIACEELIAEQIVNPQQMSKLIRCLVRGAPARETALLAGEILDKKIIIPKGFEKSSGEALESEQASFSYIFVRKFLPVLRLFLIVAVMSASVFYLFYKFLYIPGKAESIYKVGYERIAAGEYQRANERFSEAFGIHRNKKWFYTYAEAFRDERQYSYAEQKYEELLQYYPRDKKGVLDYAALETYSLRNYEKAENLLQRQLLDYIPNDPDGILAVGDNSLLWGEIDPSKYEDAYYNYARLRDQYGWLPFIIERMMKYYIRTDNLKEVLPLREWFDADPRKRPLSAESLAELGGYLLDKQEEEVKGVPNEYVEKIKGVRDILFRAIETDKYEIIGDNLVPSLPEPHYHLARYYHNLGNAHEERNSLQVAIRAFDNAREESIKRLNYRIDSHQRLADLLINEGEFLPAEENLIKGVNLYEDAVSRRLMSRASKYGKLYAGLGDLEYFAKTGDMETALKRYKEAEQHGWSPPEMKYRMGTAHYQLEDWRNALEYLFNASSELPQNRRVLYALGNAALKRGDYFAAQGYYNRLLTLLERQRVRLPLLLPHDSPEYLELAERLMMAFNNAGVANEMLAAQTGNRDYMNRAMSLYTDSSLAWDSLTRNPESMIRSSSISYPRQNMQNTLYPQTGYEPRIYIRIDRDAPDSSKWEKLTSLSWFRNQTGENN